MKNLTPNLEQNSLKPLYLQLYDYIQRLILKREIVYGDKLPSLRNLSADLQLSITTVEQAYLQLAVEGYIFSKPCSGYFVSDIFVPKRSISESNHTTKKAFSPDMEMLNTLEIPSSNYDLSVFNWTRWKKCITKVITEYPEQLLFTPDPQGEEALRYEISKYIFDSRGVKSSPDEIVIGAGTQQITSQLANLLKENNIYNISLENPGYEPVIKTFKDRGFALNPIDVLDDGIDIQKLPWNIPSAVYISPSNQYPTGAVTPVSKRYKLLHWAKENNSYVIEDDYNSELRYFGRPLPSLKSLDENHKVIYLGSFSSTLFPAAKISYMVLPKDLAKIFNTIKDNYSQTCSKTEQLALAFFMKEGWYQQGIKKTRKLFAKKLELVMYTLDSNGKDFINTTHTPSGINIILEVMSEKTSHELCTIATSLGINVSPINNLALENKTKMLSFHYNQIPTESIQNIIENLINAWKE